MDKQLRLAELQVTGSLNTVDDSLEIKDKLLKQLDKWTIKPEIIG